MDGEERIVPEERTSKVGDREDEQDAEEEGEFELERERWKRD